MTRLESAIRSLTMPVNGQYPRPWMTVMTNPEQARVFVVGYNQATGWPEFLIKDQDEYIHALFNRNGMTCDTLYNRFRCGVYPSPTRRNLCELRRVLAGQGIPEVLETNVICYSTGMSHDLDRPDHSGGKQKGRVIFQEILRMIRPEILILHGSRTGKEFARMLGVDVPRPPRNPAEGMSACRLVTRLGEDAWCPMVFAIPSLAPPAANKWRAWRSRYFEDLASKVAALQR